MKIQLVFENVYYTTKTEQEIGNFYLNLVNVLTDKVSNKAD